MSNIAIKTIDEIDALQSKTVLVRVDFNVPLNNTIISDDTRIRAAIPTIKKLIESSAKVVLISHLGRPEGERKVEFSLQPVYKRLCSILQEQGIESNVFFANNVVGNSITQQVKNLNNGDILLLENVRFYAEEKKNDAQFAQQLASYADIFVSDAFGTVHRAHASTVGVAEYLPSYAGYLVEKEYSFFQQLLSFPKHPFVAVIGGSKVSSKITVLENLLSNTDTFIIAGGMAYTFLSVQGYEIGASLYEEECVEHAKQFLEKTRAQGKTVLLPIDHIVANTFDANATTQLVDSIDIPDGLIAMDIGPKTVTANKEHLKEAKTIVWNGPMGVFEFDAFSRGTQQIAVTIAQNKGLTVVGGGDSVAAANKFNVYQEYTHVSTGGGASLEFLEGKKLPGIQVLLQEKL